MHLLQAGLAVTLFGMVASGAAVVPRGDDTKLFSGMSVGGGDIDMKPDEDVCGPNQTVLTCAKNIAKTWQIPTTAKGTKQRLRIPIELHLVKGWVEPLVQVEASECSLSKPIMRSQDIPFYCGRFWCQQQFSFTNTVTESHAFAMGSEFSISLAAEAEIPLLAKFTTTITGKESQTWTDTNTVTNASTKTHTWTLQNGEVCEPTVVQYTVDCVTKIKVADDATEWPWVLPDTINNGHSGFKVNCGHAEALKNLPGGKHDLFWQFCETIKSDAKRATMNIGRDGYQGDGVWSLDGCMWPTMPKDN